MYLLDTNTVSYALRGMGRVREHLLAVKPSEVGVSAITVAELRYGASKRQSQRLHALLDTFLAPLTELSFDGQAATRYGELAADLERQGVGIGMADTLLAAHALTLDRTFVTHNQRHFDRVEGLDWVDWY